MAYTKILRNLITPKYCFRNSQSADISIIIRARKYENIFDFVLFTHSRTHRDKYIRL